MKGNRDWPLVTVFVLCYNTGKYVIEALESIRASDYDNLQLLVIDDFSTDGKSVELVQDWIHKTGIACVFIKHTENWGICKTINQALDLAEGKYITGIGDDLWMPGRLEQEIELLEQNPGMGLVFGNALIVDKDSNLTGETYGKSDYLNSVDIENKYLSELERGNYIIPPACLYRTRMLKELGGYDEAISFEDWDMYLRIAKSAYKIKYIDHSVVKYRKYSTSVWQSRSRKLLDSIVYIYTKHQLYNKTDSFIDYLNHFKNIRVIDKIRILGQALRKRKIPLFISFLLCFIYAPRRVQFFIYRKMFLKRHSF